MDRKHQVAGGYVRIGAPKEASDSHAYARTVLNLPATFSLVYESSDGRLCLFEDAAGHLSAVDASRFA